METKNYYVNEQSGEIYCYKHGGATLRASIDSAPAGTVDFVGYQHETYWLANDEYKKHLSETFGTDELCMSCNY